MIVVVTGGTGYVGRHVAARCVARGWQVHLLTRPDSVVPEILTGKVTRHDIAADASALGDVIARVAPDCALHLASAPVRPHSAESAEQLVEANIRFPVLLLEAMRANGVRRIVNTGTFWQHYQQSTYWPTDFYAATKQAFSDLLCHYTDQHDIAAVTLKLYDTYGPDDPRRRIVTGLVDAALSGTSLDMSAGEQILDLTHVEDVAEAFALAADHVCTLPGGSNETFFVSGERMPLRALVAMINDKSDRRLDARLGARPYRVREIMDPIAASAIVPGWTPSRRVADTISEMLACA